MKYVRGLLHAATIYTPFRGAMPSTKLENLCLLLEHLYLEAHKLGTAHWTGTSSLGSKLFGDMKNPESTALGICVMLHGMGLLRRRSPSEYKLSSVGQSFCLNFFENARRTWKPEYRTALAFDFLNLEAVNVLVSYLYDSDAATAEDVVGVLGGEMREYSRILVPLGITSEHVRGQPVSKPYNIAIVTMILRLLKSLGVVTEDTKRFELNSALRSYVSSIYLRSHRESDVLIWTFPTEPLILAAVADVTKGSRKNIRILSEQMDPELVELLVSAGLFDGLNVCLATTKKPELEQALHGLKKAASLEIRYLEHAGSARYSPLDGPNMNLALSDAGPSLLTSATLTKVSLFQSRELGVLTYDSAKKNQLDEAFELFWDGQRPFV